MKLKIETGKREKKARLGTQADWLLPPALPCLAVALDLTDRGNSQRPS